MPNQPGSKTCPVCKVNTIRSDRERCRECMRRRHWSELRATANGWSLNLLAQVSGLSTRTVMRAFSGKRVRPSVRATIAALLQMPPEDPQTGRALRDWDAEHRAQFRHPRPRTAEEALVYCMGWKLSAETLERARKLLAARKGRA